MTKVNIGSGDRITIVTEKQVVSCTVNNVRKRGTKPATPHNDAHAGAGRVTTPLASGTNQQLPPCAGDYVLDMGELSVVDRGG